MTADEAVAVVLDTREALAIDAEMTVASAERAIVPFTPDATVPSPVEHRVAWIVTLSSAWGFAAVHVEDASGEIVDVVRSA